MSHATSTEKKKKKKKRKTENLEEMKKKYKPASRHSPSHPQRVKLDLDVASLQLPLDLA